MIIIATKMKSTGKGTKPRKRKIRAKERYYKHQSQEAPTSRDMATNQLPRLAPPPPPQVLPNGPKHDLAPGSS